MDGVSLEIEKWKNVLEKIGHVVYLLAGEAPNIDATIIPKLRLDHPEIKKIYYNAFRSLSDFSSEEALCQEIYKIAVQIEEKIYSLKKD